MRVAQINSVCAKGSTGRIVKEISEQSIAHGIDNTVFYGVGHSQYESSVHFGSSFSVKKHIALTRLFGNHGFYSAKETYELIEKLEKFSPDIIHLHNIHGHYLNVEVLFSYLKDKKLPIVWTLHDCWTFTGHCAYFDFVGCEKWRDGCFECPNRLNYPRSLFFDRSKELYNRKKVIFSGIERMAIVTPSQWLADLVKQSYLKEYPTHVIYNGINIEQFKPLDGIDEIKKEKGLCNKKVLLAMPGETKRKGIVFLLEMAKYMDKDYILVLIGVPKQDANKDSERVKFISYTESIEELVKWYNIADVFLNFTLEDNFPTVNIEALACGTPVVTFNTGGSPEAVNEETGVVVNKGDIAAALLGVKKLELVDYNVIRKSCRDRAISEFQSRLNYEKYIEIYEGLGI